MEIGVGIGRLKEGATRQKGVISGTFTSKAL
jgi:hypothetical protein